MSLGVAERDHAVNIRPLIRVAAGLAAIGSTRMTAQAAEGLPNSDFTLQVRVYDLARVDARTLQRALEVAERILAGAGVQVAWQPQPPDAAEAHATEMAALPQSLVGGTNHRGYIAVRIVRGFPDTSLPGALGFALPAARHGVHVTVFCDRIERVSLVSAASMHKILGHALAHEIGHVLLGTGQHSREGIMKALFSRADYWRMAASAMEFQADERVTLQEEASRLAAIR